MDKGMDAPEKGEDRPTSAPSLFGELKMKTKKMRKASIRGGTSLSRSSFAIMLGMAMESRRPSILGLSHPFFEHHQPSAVQESVSSSSIPSEGSAPNQSDEEKISEKEEVSLEARETPETDEEIVNDEDEEWIQTLDWFLHPLDQDTPGSEKNTRLTKSRNSFRFGKNKSSSVSRASSSSGKTVEVKGHSSVEELERKQGEVFRLLEYSEDAVRKNIPAYLIGLPSMVLENIISLTREIDQMSPNANSSELASLLAHVNQTVAEHALWIDHYYLYGDDSRSDHTLQSIVQNIKQAVKSLVEFVINKENQNVCDSNFFHHSDNSHNESNTSLCSQESPYPRKKLNESRSNHTHGSMPEIPSASSGFGSVENVLTRTSSPPSNKLTHSFSSDSILDNKENATSTPSKPPKYVGDYEATSSCDESGPPPIPRKTTIRGRSSHRSSYDECKSPMRQSARFSSSFDDGSEFPNRRSAGSISCSTPLSLNHSSPNCSLTHSPATSHDSVHHTPPYHPHSNHSVEERMVRGIAHTSHDGSQPGTDLTAMLSHNYDLSSLRSIADESNSSGYTSSTMNSNRTFYSHSFHSFTQESRSSSSTTNSVTEHSSQPATANHSQQSLAIHRNSRHSACSSSSRSSGSEAENNVLALNVPPPIPKKKTLHQTSSQSTERAQSQYDNIDGITSADKVELSHQFDSQVKTDNLKPQEMCSYSYSTRSSTSELGSSETSMASWESSTSSNSPATSSIIHRRYNETYGNQHNRNTTYSDKPPLPLKQRHIMKYMQIFKDYQMPEKEWFQHRRSQQMISSYQINTANLGEEFKELEFESHSLNSRFSLPNHASAHTPPALPPKRKSRSPECHQGVGEGSISRDRNEAAVVPPELCSCQIKNLPNASTNTVQLPENFVPGKGLLNESNNKVSVHKAEKRKEEEAPPQFVEDAETDTLLDSLNVNDIIVFQNDTEESDVKSASVDALVVYATYSKNGTYLEAFLTTYRTFLTPAELIAKMFYRYNKFVCRPSSEYQKAAKNAFSLLVRVVHDLVVTELTDELLEDLAQFEYNLLSKGDLKLALYFRKKLSEKLKLRKNHQEQVDFPGHYMALKSQHQHTFLDFKASDIADQMTLLDSELFSKFGIPELLHYSRDQNEEQCPNLTAFAMQINRMSSWVKTQILRSAAQDREKYYKKFIKIMKHLRKVNNNFNSCIAILSGLESGAVRRLDWPKASTDMLKEYCDLFDFEGSYRAYRQALAETKPPCIPHLGITLQDLTKLYHINPNNVDGKVNFLKRWLQFNILEDMKRFIPSKYDIRKNDNIRNFINNYEDCMNDSDLWDLSLSIKPKVRPK